MWQSNIEWTEADQTMLASYLQTPSGEKLLKLLQQAEANSNQEACKSGMIDRSFQAGIGYGRMLNHLEIRQLAFKRNGASVVTQEGPTDLEIREALERRVNQFAKNIDIEL